MRFCLLVPTPVIPLHDPQDHRFINIAYSIRLGTHHLLYFGLGLKYHIPCALIRPIPRIPTICFNLANALSTQHLLRIVWFGMRVPILYAFIELRLDDRGSRSCGCGPLEYPQSAFTKLILGLEYPSGVFYLA